MVKIMMPEFIYYNNIGQKIKSNTGFTLIEILVAVFIFAIISIITASALQTSILTKKKMQNVANHLSELQLAYVFLQQDIQQIIDRPVVGNNGGYASAFVSGVKNNAVATKSTDNLGQLRFTFTRTGHINPYHKLKMSNLQRVAYYQNGDKIYRHMWQALDQAPQSKSFPRKILANIKKFNVFYIDQYNHKYDDWNVALPQYLRMPSEAKHRMPFIIGRWLEPKNRSKLFPKAIIIELDHKSLGLIKWVFSLPYVQIYE